MQMQFRAGGARGRKCVEIDRCFPPLSAQVACARPRSHFSVLSACASDGQTRGAGACVSRALFCEHAAWETNLHLDTRSKEIYIRRTRMNFDKTDVCGPEGKEECNWHFLTYFWDFFLLSFVLAIYDREHRTTASWPADRKTQKGRIIHSAALFHAGLAQYISVGIGEDLL